MPILASDNKRKGMGSYLQGQILSDYFSDYNGPIIMIDPKGELTDKVTKGKLEDRKE